MFGCKNGIVLKRFYCIKEILVEDVAKIYVKKVFIRYRALSKIILDRDLRFIAAF